MLYTIFSFLGLIFGYILAENVKEELNDGKRYFKIISSLCLVTLTLFLFMFDLKFLYGFVLGIIMGYLVKKIYLFLGMSLVFLVNNDLKLLFGMLIFIYGLAQGGLDYMKYKKINYQTILISFILFLLPFSISLITELKEILIGCATGGILVGLLRINLRFKKEKRT